MGAAPQPSESGHRHRALDRLAEHCELTSRRTNAIEARRLFVRAWLERELGPELTRLLFRGLTGEG